MCLRLIPAIRLAFVAASCFVMVSLPSLAQTQTPTPAAELKIGGAVATPLVLTAGDLKKMPCTTLKVVNPHEKKTELYEGVSLGELFKRAGVPQGEQLRGQGMATYVLVEGSDGYRVVFSLAELDSAFLDSEVLVADTMDGAPIPTALGPFRLFPPHEKRPARWVRMLKSITVVRVPVK